MKFASRINVNSDSGLEALLAAPSADQVSFAGGLPDPKYFPENEIGLGFAKAMLTSGDVALQYSGTKGYTPLRSKIAARMRRDGLKVTAANVMLTQGAQQALDLTARLLIDRGDGIVVEGPTYAGALAAFATYQPTYHTVSVAEDGMDMNALRVILAKQQIKLVYTVPDFQNPTGSVMSLAKRRELIRLANQYDFMILEDAPYRSLRFSGINLPTLRELDTQDRVIHVGSFSKILSPGLRLGWLTASDEILSQLVNLKTGADLESSNLMMQAVDMYMGANDLDEHINDLRRVYKAKKDMMVNTLRAKLPEDVHITNPDGGFFVWLTLPVEIDAEQLLNEIGDQVSFVPATSLFADHRTKNGIRLAFTNPEVDAIERGCTILAAAIAKNVRPVAEMH